MYELLHECLICGKDKGLESYEVEDIGANRQMFMALCDDCAMTLQEFENETSFISIKKL